MLRDLYLLCAERSATNPMWDEGTAEKNRMEKALQLQCRQLLNRLKVNQSELRENLPLSEISTASQNGRDPIPDSSVHIASLYRKGAAATASSGNDFDSTRKSARARNMLNGRMKHVASRGSSRSERERADTVTVSQGLLSSSGSQDLSPRQSALAALSKARTSRSLEANNNSTMRGSTRETTDNLPIPSTSTSDNLLNSSSERNHLDRPTERGNYDTRGSDNHMEPMTDFSHDPESYGNLDRSISSCLTPKSLRRYVIDKNIKVDEGNVSWGREQYSDDISKTLNFSYSKVDVDNDPTTLMKTTSARRYDGNHSTRSEHLGEQEQRSGEMATTTSGNLRSSSLERSSHSAEPTVGAGSRYEQRNPLLSNQATASDPSYVQHLEDEGNSKVKASLAREAGRPKSILSSSSARRKQVSSRVSFQSSEGSASRLGYDSADRKMLGYDWIAALLDNDPNLVNESETFFEDLREFRRLNRDECSNQFYMSGLATLDLTEPPVVTEALSGTKVKPYKVNKRLFTEPQKRHKLAGVESEAEEETRPHLEAALEPTQEAPRFVRVSIPRSTLQSPTRFKPHRRNSFDPTDSCALREHCLLGWENSRPSCLPSASNVGISEALEPGAKPKHITTLDAAERLAASYPHPLSRPSPRLDMFPTWRRHYQDAAANISLPLSLRAEDLSQTIGNSAAVRQNTDSILNTTYSMMFDSQRLRKQRSEAAAQQTSLKA